MNLIETTSKKTEQLILGSMIYGNTDFMDDLKKEYFNGDTHKAIFKAIQTLFNKGKQIDIITVSEL